MRDLHKISLHQASVGYGREGEGKVVIQNLMSLSRDEDCNRGDGSREIYTGGAFDWEYQVDGRERQWERGNQRRGYGVIIHIWGEEGYIGEDGVGG